MSTKTPPSLMSRLMRTQGISSIGNPGFVLDAIQYVRLGRAYCYAHEQGDAALFAVGDIIAAQPLLNREKTQMWTTDQVTVFLRSSPEFKDLMHHLG